ncbi:hypothetical protein [Lentzea sp. HUAS12]|uniref:hypothetical protein n=1 Tax=Lentzea sp. HUAS12 TaxID=2951806 RepID=UPI00209D5883|nr:hypothetical protein [Lentzea sp. HUAS12]USX54039.1 hypothetical protein ND450_08030 [Lentzea sp. HUAS12]
MADELSDYLFARSTWHVGSLMTLINRGCQRAVRIGTEFLDQAMLNCVKNDAAAVPAAASSKPRSPRAALTVGSVGRAFRHAHGRSWLE